MKTTLKIRSIDFGARWSRIATFCSLALFISALQTIVQGQLPPVGARLFASPTQAAEALIAATESFNELALKEILGPGTADLIYSGDIVQDRETATQFGKWGREKMAVTLDPKNKNLALLTVGPENWPSPLPIVKKPGGWAFDAAAGRQELVYRRIGRNELDAIAICRGFVEAEHEYALEKHDGAPVNQYAQRIISTAGRQDGLAWFNPDGSTGGPVGENAARAIERGYTDKTAPYHGYFFKVLKGQGPAAPLGRLDFMLHGYMIGGFALLAYPSQYRITGVKSFIVSHDGVVYEKDLGPKTADLAEAMQLYNPDQTWVPVLGDEE